MRLALAALLALASTAALAADPPQFSLTIEGHKFTPDRIEVPAGQKVKLVIENKDDTAEEFDSGDLRAEKVIPPKTKGTVFIGPLKAGEYKFIGEFHAQTAHGVVVAK